MKIIEALLGEADNLMYLLIAVAVVVFIGDSPPAQLITGACLIKVKAQ